MGFETNTGTGCGTKFLDGGWILSFSEVAQGERHQAGEDIKTCVVCACGPKSSSGKSGLLGIYG